MHVKSKKKLIVANSLLLVFLIFGAVFAWFASNFKNYVASNEIEVVSDDDLQLSVDNANWHNSITLSNYEWFKRTTFTDITGSGAGAFARPTLELNANYASVVTDGEWTTPIPTDTTDNSATGTNKYDYVRFTLYMKSKTPYTVKLGENSYVRPASDYSSLSDLLGSTAPNKSSYGDFSKDLVAGGVRVSGINAADEHLFTWIPRPEINANSPTDKVDASKITVSAASGTESYIHKYYNAGASAVSTLSSAKTVTGDIDTTNAKTLAVLTDADSDGTYTGQVDFCIWLEGCDNEARRAFVDGKFKVYLNIVASTA